jgi:hypothetical protein
MVRLEADGGWFGPARGQPRVGGRMAIGAQIDLAGRRVTFVSVHLESNSSPAQRNRQVSHLLDVIDEYDAGAALLLGGDFNTSTVDRTRDRDAEFGRPELVAAPLRMLDVAPHEPLFRGLADRGALARKQCSGQADRRPPAGQPRASRQDRLDLHARPACALLPSFRRWDGWHLFPTMTASSSRSNRIRERGRSRTVKATSSGRNLPVTTKIHCRCYDA